MPNFKYQARDKFSKAVSGVIQAHDSNAAARKLQEMGYVPISINETHQISAGNILENFKRVRLQDINAFTRQLYSLQKAGLPLLSSLESIAQETKNKYFKAAIEDIARNIRGGISFSAALKSYPKIFDEIYSNMIRVAETGGNLVEILGRLNALIEQDIDTRSRIKAATRYPMLAFFALCVGFLVVITFVIPRFSAIYGQFNAVLPLPTRILIFISVVVRRYWYLMIIVIAAAVFTFNKLINSKTGRPVWDGLKLKAPVIGPLLTMMIMARFSRVTALMMKSGVPILEILDLVSVSCGNVVIARAIIHIKESVNQGRGMSEPMKVSSIFPETVCQMVSVGEQTGRIDELLMSVADYYDTESGYIIKNLTTYIEPVLILALGAMVLVMALAIFLPMWNLIKVFRA